jgi:hypothetical protein
MEVLVYRKVLGEVRTDWCPLIHSVTTLASFVMDKERGLERPCLWGMP